MSRAVVLSAVRTPVGRYGGALAEERPDDLAAIVIKEAVARAGVPAEEIEDVWLGAANQAGEDNRNVARMAALLAGLPDSVAGVTVNRLCASGLAAVVGACHAVIAGDGDLFVAGGEESMTRAPFVTPKAAKPYERADRPLYDTTLGWRFTNPKLVEPLGAFVGSAVAGVDPRVMGVGPIPAVRKVLERREISVDDLDLVELNEAFASQSLAVIRELGLDPEKVNVNGGAIALGHPLGMSGARLVVSLLHELRRRGGRLGLATLCVGVGQGQAALFERSG